MAQQQAQPPPVQSQQQQQAHAALSAAAPMIPEPLRSALERLAADGGAERMGPLALCALGKHVSRELQHRLMALFVFGARLNQLLSPQKAGQIRSIAADCGRMVDALRRICRRLDALKADGARDGGPTRASDADAAASPPVGTEELYFALVAAAEAGDYGRLPLDESIRAGCRRLAVERASLAADVCRLRAELHARTQRLRTADWQAAALLDQLGSAAGGNAEPAR